MTIELPDLFVDHRGDILYCPNPPIHMGWSMWMGRRWEDMHSVGEPWLIDSTDLATEQAHPSIQEQTPPDIYRMALLLAPTWTGTLTELVQTVKRM